MIIGEFNDVYPPELDGVGRVVKNYAEGLCALGDTCYYVAPNDPKYQQEATYKTLLYRGVKMPGEPYHVGVPILDLHYLFMQRPIAFDIVHAHSPFLAGQEALRLARMRKIPLVATFHSKYYDDFYQKTGSEKLASIGTHWVVDFYNHCDEVWTVNERTAQVLRDYGYQKEIIIMPNGTDPFTVTAEDRLEVQLRYRLSSDPVFLFVGQMNWKKNIKKVLEAVALYRREHPCQLMMVGQGPDEKEIQDCARELGLTDCARFTGHIADRRLMMSIFARSDLLIFPSIYDNAPMVVREAATVGTPALLVKGSCAAEGVTDGVNGLLSEDNSESIVERIKRAFPMLPAIGQQARKTIPLPWNGIIRQARLRYETLIEYKRTLE